MIVQNDNLGIDLKFVKTKIAKKRRLSCHIMRIQNLKDDNIIYLEFEGNNK